MWSLVSELIAIWERSYIPIMLKCNITRKLVTLITKYENVRKSQTRLSDGDIASATLVKEELSKLFDISHQDALQMIKIEEDRAFLVDQRGERKMAMGNVDVNLKKKSKRKSARTREEMKRNEKEIERQQKSIASAHATDSSESSAVSSSGASPEPASTSRVSLPPKRLKVTASIAAALDRTNISHRQAAHVMTAIAGADHQSSPSLPSSSTIYRARRAARSTTADHVRTEFVKEVEDNDAVLVLHWDGKLMAHIDGEPGRVDRLAVVVSSPQLSHEKLLAVPPSAQVRARPWQARQQRCSWSGSWRSEFLPSHSTRPRPTPEPTLVAAPCWRTSSTDRCSTWRVATISWSLS